MSTTTEITKSAAFTSGIEDIKAGRCNRVTLAGRLGISPSRLSQAIRKAGLIEELRSTKETVRNPHARDNLVRPDNARIQAYEPAIARAIELGNVLAAHKEFPDLSYQVLARKVKSRKETA